jgi:hypothetical protein
VLLIPVKLASWVDEFNTIDANDVPNTDDDVDLNNVTVIT